MCGAPSARPAQLLALHWGGAILFLSQICRAEGDRRILTQPRFVSQISHGNSFGGTESVYCWHWYLVSGNIHNTFCDFLARLIFYCIYEILTVSIFRRFSRIAPSLRQCAGSRVPAGITFPDGESPHAASHWLSEKLAKNAHSSGELQSARTARADAAAPQPGPLRSCTTVFCIEQYQLILNALLDSADARR